MVISHWPHLKKQSSVFVNLQMMLHHVNFEIMLQQLQSNVFFVGICITWVLERLTIAFIVFLAIDVVNGIAAISKQAIWQTESVGLTTASCQLQQGALVTKTLHDVQDNRNGIQIHTWTFIKYQTLQYFKSSVEQMCGEDLNEDIKCGQGDIISRNSSLRRSNIS